MIQRVVDTIGLMDNQGYSFSIALEKLIAHLNLEITYEAQLHRVVTRRLRSRPYDVLRAVSPYKAILNRGERGDLHFNSYLLTVAPTTYLVNDMMSFLALDKNATYGHMNRLGLHIPPTAALPGVDPTRRSERHEPFELAEIGDEIGYPAYLKPQVGAQWGVAYRVKDAEELKATFAQVGSQPMSLQRAVDYDELAHVIGMGPQAIALHCDPNAPPEGRFIRSPTQAVDHAFLAPETAREVAQITKICNAFFNWDFNACELGVEPGGRVMPIDFANVNPDCSLLDLHYFFAEVVKATARWLIFNAVTGRSKPALGHDWPKYFAVVEAAHTENWTYQEKLTAYAELADRHFETARFERFCAEHLPSFETQALEFFSSQAFQVIIEEEVGRNVAEAAIRPARMRHYMGLHRFWLHCERDRLGLPTGKWG